LPILGTGPEVFSDLIDYRGDFGRAMNRAVAHFAAFSGFQITLASAGVEPTLKPGAALESGQ
jgi:hypothetical protein